MRLIVTADWQLGKGFGGMPAEAAALLRRARLDAVGRVAALARSRGADAVLVAGDVFDGPAPAEETLRRTLAAMAGFAGPWVLLPGNHDPALEESPWTALRRLGLPAGVILADRPEPIRIGPAAILPAPLTRRHEAADLSAWFDGAETPDARFRIGLAHGAVAGLLPEAAEAANPIAADRAARARLDFLALGDWHGTLRIDARTWYPGTPEPDRFRGNAPGAALAVDLAEGAEPAVERVETLRHPWRQAALALSPGLDPGPALAALAAPGPDGGEPVVRVAVSGLIGLADAAALRRAEAEARARCLHLELDESALALAPAPEDLAAIGGTGFVRVAAERLAARLDGPEAPAAGRALALLDALAAAERGGGR